MTPPSTQSTARCASEGLRLPGRERSLALKAQGDADEPDGLRVLPALDDLGHASIPAGIVPRQQEPCKPLARFSFHGAGRGVFELVVTFREFRLQQLDLGLAAQ